MKTLTGAFALRGIPIEFLALSPPVGESARRSKARIRLLTCTPTVAERLLISVGGIIGGKKCGVARDNRWVTYTETATKARANFCRSAMV